MALGEWLSVQSSRELYKHQIGIEKAELAAAPEEEAEELALIYEARGLPKDEAQRMAQHIISDPASALETLAREELNVDPSELGGSAWEAALTSFFLFSIGAIIPVLPYTFLSGLTAVIVSMVLSAVGLFIVGCRHHPVHRAQCDLFRYATGTVRSDGCCDHLRHRPLDRWEPGRIDVR